MQTVYRLRLREQCKDRIDGKVLGTFKLRESTPRPVQPRKTAAELAGYYFADVYDDIMPPNCAAWPDESDAGDRGSLTLREIDDAEARRELIRQGYVRCAAAEMFGDAHRDS